jgi:hypothetical protein
MGQFGLLLAEWACGGGGKWAFEICGLELSQTCMMLKIARVEWSLRSGFCGEEELDVFKVSQISTPEKNEPTRKNWYDVSPVLRASAPNSAPRDPRSHIATSA